MKRIIVVVLTLLIMISSPVKICAIWPDDSSDNLIEDIENSFADIEDAVKKVPEVAQNVEAVSSLSQGFQDAIKLCQGASAVFGIINGSVTFLRMVGILKDPVQSKLNNIISQLEVMDEKMSEMDQKLNNLASEMSKMQASAEFNARSQKALSLEESWRDFAYRYMEDGLDKLISQYEGMGLNGIMKWCQNSSATDRNYGGIDNSKVIVLYKNNGSDYELTYSISNTVPSDVDRYIVVESEALPASFAWDITNYPNNLQQALIDSIKGAYSQDNSVLQVVNYDGFDPSQDYDLQVLADDIIETLNYRLTAAQVNSDATFAKEVIRQFNNYCTHLVNSDEGLDAIYKTYFLTHGFEGQVKDDINNFANRMLLKSGVYEMFVASVLGMSSSTTEAEKTSVMQKFADTIRTIKQGQNNALTGKDDYCYIVNNELWLINIYFEGAADVYMSEYQGNGKRTYEGYKAYGLKANITEGLREGSSMIGDSNMLLLTYTLAANGVDMTYDYLKQAAHGSFANDYGKIITSYNSESQLALDGTIQLYNNNVAGDYFAGKSTISKLPSDASTEYMAFRRKIAGNYYDLSSKQLKSGQTLIAYGTYGERHWYWIRDEVSIMYGPTSHEYIYGTVNSNGSGESRTYHLSLSSSYNTLMSVPLEGELQAKNGYDPLTSYSQLASAIAQEYVVPDTAVETTPFVITSIVSLIAIYFVKKRIGQNA